MAAWATAGAIVILVVHTSSFLGSGPADKLLLLDLTTSEIQHVEAQFNWGCSGGSLLSTTQGIVLPPPLPLRLRIDSVTEEPYRLGQDVASQLILTNTGNESIRIPWSVDANLVFRKDCKWLPPSGVVGLHGAVTLVLEDESGHKDFIGAHGLFGIASDPATFRELAPGDSVLIKTAGRMDLYNIAIERKKAGISGDFPIRLTVTARFTLDDTPAFGRYRPAVSENKMEVSINKE